MREFHQHNHAQGRHHRHRENADHQEARRFARGGFGHEGGAGFDHHGRRGGGRERLLGQGDLRPLILHLINEKPRHGYEIIKAIEELAGGAYAPSPGVIYPTLTLLEEIGQIAGTSEGARKSYALTDEGRGALKAGQEAVQVILARIAASQPREAALPVMRAMENLRLALRLKLAAGTAKAEIVRKIADKLDEVTRTIEEL